MSKHHTFKPSQSEIKFRRQEQRYSSRQQHCFKAPNDHGAVCVVKNVEHGNRKEGVDYPDAWYPSPENYFDEAINQILTACPVDNYEPSIGNCTTNSSHSLHYTLNWSEGGARSRYTVRQLTNLDVDLLNCQDADKNWPAYNNLTDCIEGLLAQAQTKSADSFKEPPIWPAMVATGSTLLAAAVVTLACYLVCNKKSYRTRNERADELRQPLTSHQHVSTISAARPQEGHASQYANP